MPAEESSGKHLNDDSNHYQKPRLAPCEMSKYDTPHATIDNHSEGVKNTSMKFAVGTQFENAVTGPPINTPSYNNPLASVATVENLPTFYDTPEATSKIQHLTDRLSA